MHDVVSISAVAQWILHATYLVLRKDAAAVMQTVLTVYPAAKL